MGGSRSGDGYRRGVVKQESSSVGNGQEVLGAGQGECPTRWWSTRGSEGSRQQRPREGGSRGEEGRERLSAGWTTYGWVSVAGRWALGSCCAISRGGCCRLSCRWKRWQSTLIFAVDQQLAAMGTATGTAVLHWGRLQQRDQANRSTPFASGVGPRPARALACLTP